MIQYYIVDAFADQVFQGNPAGVCLLERPMPPETMQSVAAENNLPETAFLLREGDGYRLQWFTPTFEIDLCGHATLASAHVVCAVAEPGRTQVDFSTASGVLSVRRRGEQYEMDLPNWMPHPVEPTPDLVRALGTEPLELYGGRDLFAVLPDEQSVRDYVPDYRRLGTLRGFLGISVTAPGTAADFVSRFFCPELWLEDPVTGSAHSALAPLWAEKLGRSSLTARQLSRRGGALLCQVSAETVTLRGGAALYLRGQLCL